MARLTSLFETWIMVENYEINVPFVPTDENVADFFTKPLSAPKFFAFRKILMNERT